MPFWGWTDCYASAILARLIEASRSTSLEVRLSEEGGVPLLRSPRRSSANGGRLSLGTAWPKAAKQCHVQSL